MVDGSRHKSDRLNGLVDLINHAGGLKNKKALEVGCFRGVSSEAFLIHEPAEMHFVDCWGKDKEYTESNWALKESSKDWDMIKSEFLERINPYKERTEITVIHDFSAEASKNVEDNYFDFIYIDGDHRLAGVEADLSCWFPKLAKGGYFGGHDYTNDRVHLVVNKFFDESEITTFDDKSWVIQK